MEFERRHRQLQGDDIDVDAAVEALIELKAGLDPDGAVYVNSVAGGVTSPYWYSWISLDPPVSPAPSACPCTSISATQPAAWSWPCMSSATGSRSTGSDPRGVRRCTLCRSSGSTRNLTRWYCSAWGDSCRARTQLGAAMRHGTATLGTQAGTARRLLVVLSDGLAYDHGYERAYGEADARRALAEARWQGIGCVCLSIGTDADVDALRRVFGTAAYAAISRVELLPLVVGPLFRSGLRSAELQRRVFQRRARTRGRLELERGTA